ncbi:hypothetical protein TruAng_006610 [Truncatella angustata]|nr:hypothetical protein TruAng_006610 [Truncatella angustata]
MILLAPVLFAASIYMTLQKIINNVRGEKHAIIRPAWLTRLFVAGDILALMIQGGAAGLMVVASQAQLGQTVVIIGLVLQVVMFGLFWATAAVFHIRMRHDPSVIYISVDIKWQETLCMLYGVSALIMIRSVFRIVEFVMGADGYLLRNEWAMYLFDSVPMWLVMAVFWQWFPDTISNHNSFYSVTSMTVLDPAPGPVGSVTDTTGYTNRTGVKP